MKCQQCDIALAQQMIGNGVVIDYCKTCLGAFFERGEINFFVDTKVTADYQRKGLIDPIPCNRKCPKCLVPMQQGRLPGHLFAVEECKACLSLWFDKGEFQALTKLGVKAPISKVQKKPIYAPIKPLVSLGLSSGLLILGAYGLLAIFMIILVELNLLGPHAGILLYLGLVVLEFILSPILMDYLLTNFGAVAWSSHPYRELDKRVAREISLISQTLKMPYPRVGIINDDSPAAYTYGRSPRSARVVFSKGILSLLGEKEFQAVLAHEYGHIRSWDFVIMTVVQMVPEILHFIYRRLRPKKSATSERMIFIAAAVYALYCISNYFVLFISRLREYHADYFSAKVTKNPNALVRALFKVGYGLVRNGEKDGRTSPISAFNVMNFEGANQISLNHLESDDTSEFESTLVWDLYNPWASFFELNSTHPLIAKRIKRLSHYAESLNQIPIVKFTLQPNESLWDDFFRDMLILCSPLLTAFVFLLAHLLIYPGNHSSSLWGSFMVGVALGGFFYTSYRYPGGLSRFHSIASLLKKAKVSPVNAPFVALRGKVIGRGTSGDAFSADLMLQDNTGMLFLHYQRPLAIMATWFALTKVNDLIGSTISVEGWYRREPVPRLEIYRINTQGSDYFCRVKMWLNIGNLMILILGLYLLHRTNFVLFPRFSFSEVLKFFLK